MPNVFEQNDISCFLEPRLSKRYCMLITEHLHAAPKLAQGVKALSHHETAWANTQAAWRFFNNENVTYPELSSPLIQSSNQALKASNGNYGLVLHDWCRNNYGGHKSKTDKVKMSHENDVGYEIFASLLLDSNDGEPLAPLGLDLRSKKGTLKCKHVEIQEDKKHLDQLIERISWQEQLGLARPLVHIVDREADSVTHLRQLMPFKWLTRSKQGNTVKHDDEFITLERLSHRIKTEFVGTVELKGKEAYLFVGETRVKLERKSEKDIENPPEVRVIISCVTDENGKECAKWYLLSNVMDEPAETLARWYYWRWSIESWFKVLKSHGFQMEHWQQSTAEGIFRRLIVSSMACVLAWKLYNDDSSEAKELKVFLVKLSGRLTKRSKPITHPALLAGLWVFLQLNEVLNTYTKDEIENFRKTARSFFGELV